MTRPVIRVLVVDDQPVVRRGIDAIVSSAADLLLVGEASGATEACEQCRLHEPDVVILGPAVGGGDSSTVTTMVRRACPGVAVVVMLGFSDVVIVKNAAASGALGVLTRDAAADDVLSAIRLAHDGRAVLSSPVRDMLSNGLIPSVSITSREHDVLARVATGCTNAEIAASLSISVSTVNFHVHNLLVKLGVPGRADAVAAARSRGLLAT